MPKAPINRSFLSCFPWVHVTLLRIFGHDETHQLQLQGSLFGHDEKRERRRSDTMMMMMMMKILIVLIMMMMMIIVPMIMKMMTTMITWTNYLP
jgi:hypothetical protein